MNKYIIYFLLTICLFSLGNSSSTYAYEIEETILTTPSLPEEPEYNPIKSIKLNYQKISANKGDTRYLEIYIKYGKKTHLKNEPYLWYSSNPKVATVNKKGEITGLKNGKTTITFKAMHSKVKAKCKVTIKNTKYVSFTFDDGPGKYTNQLLKSLDKYDSKATFFLLGKKIKGNEKLVKKTYNLNMEIGSHSYSHPNFNTISEKEIKKEIRNTSSAIKNITGNAPTLFRPPYGIYNKIVVANCNAPMIYWTVDFEDWKNRNTQYVYKQILKQSDDGDIILLHDIHKTTVAGFKKALPKLKKRGYQLVTVSELYKIKGVKLKNGKMHYGPNNDTK